MHQPLASSGLQFVSSGKPSREELKASISLSIRSGSPSWHPCDKNVLKHLQYDAGVSRSDLSSVFETLFPVFEPFARKSWLDAIWDVLTWMSTLCLICGLALAILQHLRMAGTVLIVGACLFFVLCILGVIKAQQKTHIYRSIAPVFNQVLTDLNADAPKYSIQGWMADDCFGWWGPTHLVISRKPQSSQQPLSIEEHSRLAAAAVAPPPCPDIRIAVLG